MAARRADGRLSLAAGQPGAMPTDEAVGLLPPEAFAQDHEEDDRWEHEKG